MATSHSSLTLAGLPGDNYGRLMTIGVQPVELADIRGCLYSVVMRQIIPAIERALACLMLKGVTPLQCLAAG